ncbi:MAG: permease, partial [Acidobacteria bacterium]
MRVQADGIRNWPELLARMQQQPHVRAVSPALYEQVLISRGARATGAVLKGIMPQYENQVSELLKDVTFGSAAALESTSAAQNPSARDSKEAFPPIVLGKEMADDLGAAVGSVVLITSPQGELTP